MIFFVGRAAAKRSRLSGLVISLSRIWRLCVTNAPRTCAPASAAAAAAAAAAGDAV